MTDFEPLPAPALMPITPEQQARMDAVVKDWEARGLLRRVDLHADCKATIAALKERIAILESYFVVDTDGGGLSGPD